MIILGLETSCDETAAAIVVDGRRVLSNVVFSQIAKHRPYGGVVPEVASRCHVEVLPGVIRDALQQAGVGWDQVDALAVTRGPGLAPSLLIGVTAARALSMTLNKPLLPVHHLEAHLYSIFLSDVCPPSSVLCPLLILLVTGGNTMLIRMDGIGQYEVIGQTVDDAAGEALDKGAKLLGLGYPGGPEIEQAAAGGNPQFVRFPRGLENREGSPRTGGLPRELCFSFSGLKTALLNFLKEHPVRAGEPGFADVAASYQEAVFDALIDRADRALRNHQVKTFACVGGVARNRTLRSKLAALGDRHGLSVLLAPPEYCTDNAAMIAALAGARFEELNGTGADFDVDPNLPLMDS